MGDAILAGLYLAIVVIVIVTIIMFVRLRRKAAHPHLSMRERMAYPDEVRGCITRMRGGTIEATYDVEGVRYTIVVPVEPLERVYVETNRHSGTESARHTYTTTTLGDVCEGGEIRVRYRKDNPSEAVLMPNPVIPR